MTVQDVIAQRDHDRWGTPVQGVLEDLSRQECLDLLAALPIGRLVYTRQALPAVEPVNFAVSNDEIVIRTRRAPVLAAAARGDVVAFEADAFDSALSSGWSVTVIGRCRQASDEESSRLRELQLVSWTPGENDHFICIGIGASIVTGILLHPPGEGPLPG